MSESGGAGRREVAYRLFAAEYDDASWEYSEEDEERAPNYVVTPTGARVNRLFVVGVLTEVEQVSDDVLRGRIVDPTGAFVVYAGQYQPDPKTFLERVEAPAFVAVTGKARTFTPDDSDRVFTSVRPESINEVDAETRDRWVVGAAEHTIDRVATFADALERDERGDELRDALLAEGVDEGLAEGIPLAIEHYGTTGAYLAAVRELAIQAAAVVAGERDEVEPLALSPDEGGPADADLTAVGAASASTSGSTAESVGSETSDESGASGESVDATETIEASESTTSIDDLESAVDTETTETAADEGAAGDPDSGVEVDVDSADEEGDVDSAEEDVSVETDEEPLDADEAIAADPTADEVTAADPTADEQTADASTDGLYELDEEERERVTEEYGTEFTSGADVDEPGEADIETPGPAEDAEQTEGEATVDEEPTDDEASTDDAAEVTSTNATDEDSAAETDTDADAPDEGDVEPAEDVDVESAAIDAMADLDDGDGAERDAVVAAVVDEYGVDPGVVDDAIQDALMSGMCYEPAEDRLKAI